MNIKLVKPNSFEVSETDEDILVAKNITENDQFFCISSSKCSTAALIRVSDPNMLQDLMHGALKKTFIDSATESTIFSVHPVGNDSMLKECFEAASACVNFPPGKSFVFTGQLLDSNLHRSCVGFNSNDVNEEHPLVIRIYNPSPVPNAKDVYLLGRSLSEYTSTFNNFVIDYNRKQAKKTHESTAPIKPSNHSLLSSSSA